MSLAQAKLAAKAIQQARKTGIPCAPIRSYIGPDNIKWAYKVQGMVTLEQVADGKVVIGRKIGLTSKAVQNQLGVDQPDFGMLFHDMELMLGEELAWNRVIQPKVEAEVAFVLNRDLNHEKIGLAQVIRAVSFALPCLEIVDSRINNWDISIADTIADNASSGFFVLGHGPKRLDNIDISQCKMEMSCNGQVVSTGQGNACLGSPINALWWLARTMAQMGHPLRTGDVVLSGALGPVYTAKPGDHYNAQIEGLGEVSMRFGTQ
jgi:2-keto-4-pentenoate hydratase